MIGAWTMRPIVPEPEPRSGRRALIQALDDAGFTGIVATDTEQTYLRYLRPGDRVRARISVETVSEQKQTALGVGHFFTTTTTYEDHAGEVVATERFRMLKFKPKPRPAGSRPHPAMNQDSAYFWEGARAGQLLIQRCIECATLRHPARAACSACGSLRWDTVASTGEGSVYSYVVYHHPPSPGFEVPYVVALIDLDEGVRMVSNVIGIAPAEVTIGMRVSVEFVATDEELTLPMFRPAS
jgi:uncharacterized protein